MNTRERRTKQEYALLLCGEYFRDQLQFGAPGHHRDKFEALRTIVFDALGDPSYYDADKIRERRSALIDHEAEYANICNGLAESVLDATEEEIDEEMRLEGLDPKQEADKVRQILRDAVQGSRG